MRKKAIYKGCEYYYIWCKDCEAYIDHGWYKPILDQSAINHRANYPGHDCKVAKNTKTE